MTPQTSLRQPGSGSDRFCDLLLIRHGEPQPAIPGHIVEKADGHADPRLSPSGRTQATALAQRLQTQPIGAIYVSSLRRASQTASALASATGVVPNVEPDLREVFLGDWEGWVYAQRVAQNDPLVVRMKEAESWELIPGAETDAALRTRVERVIGRIASRHPGERVVAVTHAGVISTILALASGSRPWAFMEPDHVSISRVLVTSESWKVKTFNDTAHLELSSAG